MFAKQPLQKNICPPSPGEAAREKQKKLEDIAVEILRRPDIMECFQAYSSTCSPTQAFTPASGLTPAPVPAQVLTPTSAFTPASGLSAAPASTPAPAPASVPAPVPGKIDLSQQTQFSARINAALEAVLQESDYCPSPGDKQKIIQYIADELFGYGPINPFLQDATVSEIMVNGYAQVFVERKGKLEKTGATFRDNAHLLQTIDKIITPLGRRVDEDVPMVDARLPDGSRVNAIIPPLAVKGPALTIRKFAADPFTAEDLISFGTMTAEIGRFLKACVRARANILVSGGTGSGKTTTLNILSSFIPERERIVTIEDAAELQLQQEHVVTLESRPANIKGKDKITIRDLMINSLRMRPDRIVVGEVRGGEALDMLQAMNTGHDGSMSTLHANNPRDALARVETMVLMAGMDLPLRAIREQVSSAINLIVQQTRFNDGSRKITNITEVVGMEGEIITLQDIFVFQQSAANEKGRIGGKHLSTGIVPKCLERLRAYGEEIPRDVFIEKNAEKPFRRF